jgi:hypothetical protein
MAKITPADFADKWGRRLKAATDDMAKGINAVTEAPTVKAAAKQDKMIAHLQAKVQDGTWAARLRSVSLDDWKTAITEKGLPRVSGGVDRAQGKVANFATQLLGYQERGLADISKMPDVTLEDSLARMEKWIRYMSKFSPK